MNELVQGTKDEAIAFVSKVRGYLTDAAKSFFKIGYELHKAQEEKHYKALGYESLEDLAEDAFGFSKTTMYDMLAVYGSCRSPFVEGEMCEAYKPYSFSQLAAMKSGRFATPYALTNGQRVKPTDSVRAIKKYVSFFNKYTDKNSSYPNQSLQEWLAQEEERQELENSEQLQLVELGELVEEETDEKDEEKFRTSGLQEFAEDEETGEAEELDEPEEIEEEEPEAEYVSQETETSKYSFSNRENIRAFYGDYKKWGFYISWAMWQKCYRYDFRNGMSVYAVESTICKDIANMVADGTRVRYFWKDKGQTYEVSVLDMERYIATIKDEL